MNVVFQHPNDCIKSSETCLLAVKREGAAWKNGIIHVAVTYATAEKLTMFWAKADEGDVVSAWKGHVEVL